MANILGDDTKQQILALGRLGWPLRRIEQATGVRRETASAYLKAAGIAIRAPRRRSAAAKTGQSGVHRPRVAAAGPHRPADVAAADPIPAGNHRSPRRVYVL